MSNVVDTDTNIVRLINEVDYRYVGETLRVLDYNGADLRQYALWSSGDELTADVKYWLPETADARDNLIDELVDLLKNADVDLDDIGLQVQCEMCGTITDCTSIGGTNYCDDMCL